MAIYNNREVSVIGPNSMANTSETVNVQHINGSTENVPVAAVYFTDEEKEALKKRNPGRFDDVKTVSKDDVEAVRTGVAPSFDPSYKEAAKAKIQSDKQAEISKKNADAAKKQAEKESTDKPVTTPATSYNPNTVTSQAQ